MSELLNEAEAGSVDEPIVAPLSIRDSLKAAMSPSGDEKPIDEGAGKPRDESGRFTKTEGQQPVVQAKPVETVAKPTPQAAAQAPATPAVEQAPVAATPAAPSVKPPSSWSQDAKADFANLPPHVQAAVAKREEEIDNGFKVLQDYKGLEEFTPLMKQSNTTHADVMRKAIGWEQSLIKDPVNTVINVANMAGVNLHALVNGQTDQILQRRPQQQQAQPQPQPVDVESTVEQVLRRRDTENQIQSFLSDPANAHAEAVIDDMVALINTGRAKNLKDAYDAACWMRPDIRQQLISQATPAPVVDPQIAQRAAAADQARKASRSITGSSAPGPSKGAAPTAPTSIRDSLKEAFAASNSRA